MLSIGVLTEDETLVSNQTVLGYCVISVHISSSSAYPAMFQWCYRIHSLLHLSNQWCGKFQDPSSMEGSWKKFNCFLKVMSVEVGVFLLSPLLFPSQIQVECSLPFQIKFFHYTISGHYFSQTVLSKCLFILRYICFLSKNHRCRMNTNFLDDGR
jgi:hypothetical protein